MQLNIIKTSHTDVDDIFTLYDKAIIYQQEVGNSNWLGFERALIEKEIDEARHFKILADGQLACTFCITFTDPLIWKVKNDDPSIYIHRIATHPDFKGRGMVKHIVKWANQYGKDHHKKYIRMDTSDGNERLNKYYISCGFNHIGATTIDYTPELPAHYKSSVLFALFEMEIV